MSESEREAAIAKAAANARAIFSGDCAVCHMINGRDKMGQALYAADCGICHESPRRASFVPDLHALKQPGNLDFWKTIIAAGKTHTLMPPFSMALGGPLTDEQVNSLAEYLNRVISHNFASMTNAAAAGAAAPPL
jgi:mono/diheme cytochrome c family protein